MRCRLSRQRVYMTLPILIAWIRTPMPTPRIIQTTIITIAVRIIKRIIRTIEIRIIETEITTITKAAETTPSHSKADREDATTRSPNKVGVTTLSPNRVVETTRNHSKVANDEILGRATKTARISARTRTRTNTSAVQAMGKRLIPNLGPRASHELPSQVQSQPHQSRSIQAP